MSGEGMGQHCQGSACEQTQVDLAAPVCECDCEDCEAARRPPETVLADAYDALREEHNDFGDEGALFRELTETLARILRDDELGDILAAERKTLRG
jgi:hypothetical protein